MGSGVEALAMTTRSPQGRLWVGSVGAGGRVMAAAGFGFRSLCCVALFCFWFVFWPLSSVICPLTSEVPVAARGAGCGGDGIKPIERLVPVSCTRYRASTSGLSTWWSSTALIGNPGFEGGFPLRCFQRLSRPHIATRRCGWRHNRYTRGASIPVLSY